MRLVVLSGGLGAGKTTLLSELGSRGFATVSDSAREVIAERRSRGESPRPDPESFAREILRRDARKYAAQSGGDVAFYDRSAIEALGMLKEIGQLENKELSACLASFAYYKTVFVLPPWREIYRTDSERDHSFEHAVRVHQEVIRWYRRCGYEVNEVPRLPVTLRADHVLACLHASGGAYPLAQAGRQRQDARLARSSGGAGERHWLFLGGHEMEAVDSRSDSRRYTVNASPSEVFAAMSQPERIARWWGPTGFSNTIHEFEFKPNGRWLLTMHGPDGKDYPNESRFTRIIPGKLFEIEHFGGHHFILTVELEGSGDATEVRWRQTFDTAEHYKQIAEFVAAANQQNLERLAAEVQRGQGAA